MLAKILAVIRSPRPDGTPTTSPSASQEQQPADAVVPAAAAGPTPAAGPTTASQEVQAARVAERPASRRSNRRKYPQLFKGLRIYVAPMEIKEDLETCIVKYGGEISLAHDATYLVARAFSDLPRCSGAAAASREYVLRPDFISDCVSSNILLEPVDYLLGEYLDNMPEEEEEDEEEEEEPPSRKKKHVRGRGRGRKGWNAGARAADTVMDNAALTQQDANGGQTASDGDLSEPEDSGGPARKRRRSHRGTDDGQRKTVSPKSPGLRGSSQGAASAEVTVPVHLDVVLPETTLARSQFAQLKGLSDDVFQMLREANPILNTSRHAADRLRATVLQTMPLAKSDHDSSAMSAVPEHVSADGASATLLPEHNGVEQTAHPEARQPQETPLAGTDEAEPNQHVAAESSADGNVSGLQQSMDQSGYEKQLMAPPKRRTRRPFTDWEDERMHMFAFQQRDVYPPEGRLIWRTAVNRNIFRHHTVESLRNRFKQKLKFVHAAWVEEYRAFKARNNEDPDASSELSAESSSSSSEFESDSDSDSDRRSESADHEGGDPDSATEQAMGSGKSSSDIFPPRSKGRSASRNRHVSAPRGTGGSSRAARGKQSRSRRTRRSSSSSEAAATSSDEHQVDILLSPIARPFAGSAAATAASMGRTASVASLPSSVVPPCSGSGSSSAASRGPQSSVATALEQLMRDFNMSATDAYTVVYSCSGDFALAHMFLSNQTAPGDPRIWSSERDKVLGLRGPRNEEEFRRMRFLSLAPRGI